MPDGGSGFFWINFRLLEIQSQCLRSMKKRNKAHLMLQFRLLMSHRARHLQVTVMSLNSVSQRLAVHGL